MFHNIVSSRSVIIARQFALYNKRHTCIAIISKRAKTSNKFSRPSPDAKAPEQLTFKERRHRDQTALYYMMGLICLMAGFAYWSVPLYRVFCESLGQGTAAAVQGHDADRVESMEPDYENPICVHFDSKVMASLPWEFKPSQGQDKIIVYPGETCLAFYTATNKTDHPLLGVSTYQITPYKFGQYFNKIQCFCFEEQLLNPGESVDMPVFFYIDPSVSEDVELCGKDQLRLQYIFHPVESTADLPRLPGYEHIKIQKAESMVKFPS
jgi:cytochrome c oxidase assembly protein subunit 11